MNAVVVARCAMAGSWLVRERMPALAHAPSPVSIEIIGARWTASFANFR